MLTWVLFLSAWAGEYKPLCQKVHESDLIIEIQFEHSAVYPIKHKEREWAPPDSELRKIAETGVVSHVFKGDTTPGSPWIPEWGIRFDPGTDSVSEWQKLFDRKSFKQIFFFQQAGLRLSSTGWAEESAPCAASAHRSWCSDYTQYKQKIVACMTTKRAAKSASH